MLARASLQARGACVRHIGTILRAASFSSTPTARPSPAPSHSTSPDVSNLVREHVSGQRWAAAMQLANGDAFVDDNTRLQLMKSLYAAARYADALTLHERKRNLINAEVVAIVLQSLAQLGRDQDLVQYFQHFSGSCPDLLTKWHFALVLEHSGARWPATMEEIFYTHWKKYRPADRLVISALMKAWRKAGKSGEQCKQELVKVLEYRAVWLISSFFFFFVFFFLLLLLLLLSFSSFSYRLFLQILLFNLLAYSFSPILLFFFCLAALSYLQRSPLARLSLHVLVTLRSNGPGRTGAGGGKHTRAHTRMLSHAHARALAYSLCITFSPRPIPRFSLFILFFFRYSYSSPLLLIIVVLTHILASSFSCSSLLSASQGSSLHHFLQLCPGRIHSSRGQ